MNSPNHKADTTILVPTRNAITNDFTEQIMRYYEKAIFVVDSFSVNINKLPTSTHRASFLLHSGKLSDALNLGAKYIQTEFVRRFDDDDIILPHDSTKSTKYLMSGMDVVADQFYELDSGRIVEPLVGFAPGHEVPSWIFLISNPIRHPGVFYRKDWICTNEYEESHAEDLALWLSTSSHSKIYMSENVSFIYKLHGDQKFRLNENYKAQNDKCFVYWLDLLHKNLGKYVAPNDAILIFSLLFNFEASSKMRRSEFDLLLNIYEYMESRILSMEDNQVSLFYRRILIVSILKILKKQTMLSQKFRLLRIFSKRINLKLTLQLCSRYIYRKQINCQTLE